MFLFQNSKPQVKKDDNEDFDVPMGCYDGPEICELVGSFILNQLGSVIDKNDIGSIGMAALEFFVDSQRQKKLIVKTFKQCELAITIECNLKTVNFLNIRFGLQNNVFKPNRKTNHKPTYINKNSNYPTSILKQFTKSIEKRLSETSSIKDIFNKSLKLYQDALKDSGFSNDLHHVENKNNTNDNKQKRKGKITWFNPPFSKSVKTNIVKIFLQLLSKHFPKNHKMHKIFHRNTVKVSYSCMKNIGYVISAHNRNILSSVIQSYGCNCRVKSICPRNGECLTPKVIYRAHGSNDKKQRQKVLLRLSRHTP